MPIVRVVPGVCHFTVNQHWAGTAQPIANILDMHITTAGIGTSRHEAIVDQAEIISDRWVADLFPHLADDLVIDGVTWLDYNTEDGESGFTNRNSGTTGEEVGAVTSPDNAVLVKKTLTSAGRGRRSGRMYLSGILEGDIDEDGIVAVGDFSSAVSDFLGNINQNAGLTPPSYDSGLVVTHFPATEPGFSGVLEGTYSTVDDLDVQTLKAGQDRRVGR